MTIQAIQAIQGQWIFDENISCKYHRIMMTMNPKDWKPHYKQNVYEHLISPYIIFISTKTKEQAHTQQTAPIPQEMRNSLEAAYFIKMYYERNQSVYNCLKKKKKKKEPN